MSDYQETFDAAIAKAKAAGFEIVRGEPTRLLLDLDTPEAIRTYRRLEPRLRETFGWAERQTWTSKGGVGLHVVLQLEEPMDFTVRVALQAALGSDGVREALALMLADKGVEEPSVLFRPPPEAR